MNMGKYDQWIQRHQVEADDVDLTTIVMNRIDQNNNKSNAIKTAWETVVLDFIQTKIWVRAGVLAAGAAGGLVRMIFAAYCGLFT